MRDDTVKHFLYSIRDEQGEIDELTERIREQELSLLPGAVRYDGTKVQTSTSDIVTERMARVADYVAEMEKRKARLTARRMYAQRMIASLEDPLERQVLDLYFLSAGRPKMDAVADMIGYSERQTYNIYKSALEHLTRDTGAI